MQRVALVTDSTAGLPQALRDELGITVVPASFAFAEERALDGSIPWGELYSRMAASGIAPRTFGVAEAAFRKAFNEALTRAESVFCLLTPFDVNPSFTTACAAMLALQFDTPEAKIKVANAGVGSAGLGALMISLAGLVKAGAGVEELADALDDLEPTSDSLFVVEDPAWLERSGRLALVEERLGALDGRTPVLRIGTRLMAVAATENFEAALDRIVEDAGRRADGAKLNAVILHAAAEPVAAHVREALVARYDICLAEISELPATHGALLGPGAVGVGVCPAINERSAANA